MVPIPVFMFTIACFIYGFSFLTDLIFISKIPDKSDKVHKPYFLYGWVENFVLILAGICNYLAFMTVIFTHIVFITSDIEEGLRETGTDTTSHGTVLDENTGTPLYGPVYLEPAAHLSHCTHCSNNG